MGQKFLAPRAKFAQCFFLFDFIMTDLKQTTTIERERLQMLRQLANVSRSLQQTMAELLSIEELDVPADLGDITEDWLQREIVACASPIRQDRSLTAAEKQERLRPWKALRQRVLRLVDIIQGILVANPDVVFTIENDENGPRYFISEAQIEEVARRRATHTIPPEGLLHLELIQEVREKVENLRAFENQHNVRRYTIGQLMNLPWTGALDELWATGGIFKDTVEEKYKNFFPTYKQSKEYFQHKQQIKNQ